MFGRAGTKERLDALTRAVEELKERTGTLESKKVYYCEMCHLAFEPHVDKEMIEWANKQAYIKFGSFTYVAPAIGSSYVSTTHCSICYPKYLAEKKKQDEAHALGEWAKSNPDAARQCKAKWDAAQKKEGK